jgi:hypothetical protein
MRSILLGEGFWERSTLKDKRPVEEENLQKVELNTSNF